MSYLIENAKQMPAKRKEKRRGKDPHERTVTQNFKTLESKNRL